MNENDSNTASLTNKAQFDPSRAAQLRTKVVDAFAARIRKVERRLYIFLVVLVVLACAMMRNFFQSTEIQAQIFWAVLFLVMLESTILMKLWYWIVTTRLGTQRELRLLRFDLVAGKNSLHGIEELSQIESPLRPVGHSRWERTVWTAAILILGFGIATGGDFRFLKYVRSGGPGFENVVKLQADGNGQQMTRWTYANRQPIMLREIPLYSGPAVAHTELISASDSPYRDSKGRTLAFRREPAGQNHRDVIQLIDPVPAGGKAELHWVTKVEATRERALWVYRMGPGNSYSAIVELPSGAEIVSVEPADALRRAEGGCPVIEFHSRREMYEGTIKYRLPVTASEPAKAD